MNSSNHLKVLAILLAVVGLVILFYQIFVLKTPVSENKMADFWTIDARISFEVRESRSIELQFYLPAKNFGFDVSNELLIASGYGQSILENGENRLANLTARKVSGRQTIFYRFNLSRSTAKAEPAPGETWRSPIPVSDADKAAMDALVVEIRQKSADTASFITTAILKMQDERDDNVKLILRGDLSAENRLRVLELLLSQAYIPVEAAHVFRLSESGAQPTELWLRSYIEITRNQEAGWQYFNLESGVMGLPDDRLVWWLGNDVAAKTGTNSIKPRISYSLSQNELTARSLEKMTGGNDFSLYILPQTTQLSYKLMLMIPFGVFAILLIRNVVGIETLGTFTPVLIALAFLETGLIFGAVFFTVIISLGLILRAYLEHLKLQMLPRLSVVLTAVIMLIIGVGMLCYRAGFERGLAISLFPMVILTMSIERLSITWEERGGSHAFKVAIGTMAAASCVYMVLDIKPLSYFVFTFPAILLVLIAIMLGLGRYRGYRLMELLRFKALLGKNGNTSK